MNPSEDTVRDPLEDVLEGDLWQDTLLQDNQASAEDASDSSEGDEVTEGQTLVIIEAMKTMNQLPSPRAGRVKAVLIENGEPVEFGEPLIIIE